MNWFVSWLSSEKERSTGSSLFCSAHSVLYQSFLKPKWLHCWKSDLSLTVSFSWLGYCFLKPLDFESSSWCWQQCHQYPIHLLRFWQSFMSSFWLLTWTKGFIDLQMACFIQISKECSSSNCLHSFSPDALGYPISCQFGLSCQKKAVDLLCSSYFDESQLTGSFQNNSLQQVLLV